MIRTGEERPAAGRKASVLGLLLAAITLMLGYATGANAAPGDLDTTFSSDGRLTTDFGSVTDRVNDVAIQDNGKVVAAGITQSVNGDGTIDFALARYNPNGSLDATFGSGGRVVTSFGAGDDHAYAIAIQGDGKIVVAGSSGGDFALARYRANGNPDPTFSGDGRLTTDFGSASDVAYGLALQADGRIVAAGQTSQSDFALARYNPDGTLDETFDGAGGNGNGKVTTELGSSEGVKDVAIQQDGRIVVAGYTVDHTQGEDYNFALARYDSSGTLDTTFSGDGVLATDFGDHEFFDHDEAEALAVKKDGSIFAAGWSEGQASSTFALARYDENGNLVGSFGAGGKVLTGFEDDPQSLSGAAAFDLKVQPGGKLVAAGYSKGDFALARYSPSGALDKTFSGDGRLTTDFGKGDDHAYALAIRSDGKLVAAGTSGGNFALARYYGGSDTKAPRVIGVTPPGGASGVSPTASVSATFSDTMDPATVTVRTFKLFRKGSTKPVRATVRYRPAKKKAVLDPNNSLRPGATYKAVVTTRVKDLAGNRLDQNPGKPGDQPKVWFFTVRK